MPIRQTHLQMINECSIVVWQSEAQLSKVCLYHGDMFEGQGEAVNMKDSETVRRREIKDNSGDKTPQGMRGI